MYTRTLDIPRDTPRDSQPYTSPGLTFLTVNKRAVHILIECFLVLLQYVWQGFSDHRESEKGYGWTYKIWAPLSCSLPALEGTENQQFLIEKIEKYEPEFGVTEYDIYVRTA